MKQHHTSRFILFALFLLVPGVFTGSWSQVAGDRHGHIRGWVLDDTSGDSLGNVLVEVVGSRPRRVVATDPHGCFLISPVPVGIVDLRVTDPGHTTAHVTGVAVAAGQTTEVGTIRLLPLPGSLLDVTILAERKRIDTGKASQRLVGDLPGFKVDEEGALHARGGRADGTKFVINGMHCRDAWAPSGVEGSRFGNMGTPGGEEYQLPSENGFLRTARQPLSTVSVDVDVASYTNMRRFLQQGSLPPADAMRVEEWINFFPYQYPQPEDGQPFSVTTELSSAPWTPNHQLLLIGLQGRELAVEDLPPCNLVFLIDVSGSMQPENKLPLVKASLLLLVDQMRPQDRVAIVTYAGSAGLALPSTPGSQKERIRDAIQRLQAGGSTAGQAGMALAYGQARENWVKGGTNRVVWATDGDFNVGMSSTEQLVKRIEDERESGVTLSMLGFGMGNLKDHRLEQLADAGNGHYAYVDSYVEARRLLVGQMAGTLFTIAKDVKLQLEFNPALVKAYRLIGYENRLLADEDFADDTRDAGDIGAGHRVTALYELVPADQPFPGDESELVYQERKLTERACASGETARLNLRYKEPDAQRSRLVRHLVTGSPRPMEHASANMRFASAVAELGLLLRQSPHRGQASYQELRRRAEGALRYDPEGYRAEFVRLVDLAHTLQPRDER